MGPPALYDVTLPCGAMLQVVWSMETLAMAATFFQRMGGIAAAYSDLLHTLATNRVDLVVLNDAPPLLVRRITRGTLLYARSEEDVYAFERDVQLRAADVEAFVQRGRARLLEALGA